MPALAGPQGERVQRERRTHRAGDRPILAERARQLDAGRLVFIVEKLAAHFIARNDADAARLARDHGARQRAGGKLGVEVHPPIDPLVAIAPLRRGDLGGVDHAARRSAGREQRAAAGKKRTAPELRTIHVDDITLRRRALGRLALQRPLTMPSRRGSAPPRQPRATRSMAWTPLVSGTISTRWFRIFRSEPSAAYRVPCSSCVGPLRLPKFGNAMADCTSRPQSSVPTRTLAT